MKGKSKRIKVEPPAPQTMMESMALSIFQKPIVRSQANLHIQKACLNMAIVAELVFTQEQADLCEDIVKNMVKLCDAFQER